ncbi:MAG: response regulator transcription factor [Alphaproteobacteria bacterium]|nr:response regulator transcription factor [Alphaproteobacteria bacterium]
MKKGTVLTIDDDNDLQMVMEQYLEGEGYRVLKAGDVKSAGEAIETTEFDVILLDLGLPDGEGLTLIPQLKAKSDAAILVVSGKSDTTEKIVCLEMGADDYLTKPFEMRELAARIKAVARRIDHNEENKADSQPKSDVIKLEKWTLDRGQYQAFSKDGTSLNLTTGEFQLLEALVMAPNRALSREQLFELTRDGAYDIYDRAIDIQVGRIRKKIGDDKGEIIKTIRGVGYMYVGKAEAA